MRKIWKRGLPLLLCLVLAVSLMATAASALEEDTTIPKLDAAQLKDEWKKDQDYTLADPAPWNVEELKQVVDVQDPRSVAAYYLWAIVRMTDNYNDGLEMMKYLWADFEPFGRGFTPGSSGGVDSYLSSRAKDPATNWQPRTFFNGASSANGYTPDRPMVLELYYNDTNTETMNAQTLESLGRLNIEYWVQSYAVADRKVNISLCKFDGSDRWYVTSTGNTFGGVYTGMNAAGGIELAKNTPNDSSTADEHAAKYGSASSAFTVTFNANGGTVSPASAVTSAEGILATLPTPLRSGYTFDGWYTAAAGGSQVTLGQVYTADTTIYAHWTEIPAAQDNPFADVNTSDYYYDAVLWAYYSDPQVTKGIDETHFGPAQTVTRGQCVTFLWRAKGEPEPTSSTNPFVDVDPADYWYKAILWAVEKGITVGTDATHFSPSKTLSTRHIITFLYRTLNPGQGGPNGGWDGEAEAWAKKDDPNGLPFGVNIAVSDGTNCPRADVVQFLFKTK